MQLSLGKRATGFLIAFHTTLQLGLKAKCCTCHTRLALVEGTDLEEALAGDLDKVGSLVRQIHPLVLVQTEDHLVLEHILARQARLTDHVLGAVVVEELVVHHAGPPGHDAVLPAELQRGVVLAHLVLLGPVELEVGKGCVVEEAQHGELVRVLVDVLQIGAVLIESASLHPARCDTGVVLPLVEQTQMLRVLVVQSDEVEVLVQGRDVATVDAIATSWLRCSARVTQQSGLGGGRHHVVKMRHHVGRVPGREPDGLLAQRRSASLPESASKNEHLDTSAGRRLDTLGRLRHVDSHHGKGKSLGQVLCASALQTETELLYIKVVCEERVQEHPGLRKRGRLLVPADSPNRTSSRARILAVIRIRDVIRFRRGNL
ncbi:hypothetical protein HG530_012265 [Fusarium avenaceum]|nr:hypothetical protein HG530_012265 [Fusarium avenaceum]